MKPRSQRTCPECGQSQGGHFTGCPETPDEPEEPVAVGVEDFPEPIEYDSTHE